MTKTRSTAKGMLSLIDKFLSEADKHEVRQLWNVLTALRGPDSGSDMSKAATTGIVRKKAFPISFIEDGEGSGGMFKYSTDGKFGALGSEDSDTSVESRQELSNSSDWHFRMHQQEAFRVLGLKWEEKN